MRDHEQQIREAGATVAAIGLGGRSYARNFRDDENLDFLLLVDHDRRAYHAAGLGKGPLSHLLRRDNRAAQKRAQAAGHRQHRLGKDPLQLGGSFVFAPGHGDLFIHRSETFGDNAPPEDLVGALPKS